MVKRNLHYAFLLFLIIYTIYSFVQHVNISLDGDMADTILPSEWFRKVLDDPFGFSVLFNNEVYAAPNRFFAHWAFSKYFKIMPGVLQSIVDPIDSVYIACAIAKTATQLFLILVLASYISGKKKIFSKEFLLAASLITPFFITYQYWRFGIISDSITVVFFYPLPLAFLLLFFLPFFKKLFYGQEIRSGIIYRIYLILLAVVATLSGALIPGVVVIVCPVVLLCLLYRNYKHSPSMPFIERSVSSVKKIPRDVLFFFLLITMLSLYSLYIGTHNIENDTIQVSLSERYSLLPNGVVKLLTSMPLLTLLIIMVIINAFIIRKYFNAGQGQKILNLLKWTLICSSIYILLLPLGGYRSYRPDILRFDTILPVTLSIMIIFGLTTFFLIFNLSHKFKIVFSSVIIIFLLIYCVENKSTIGDNRCERNALNEISRSQEDIVQLSSDCTIMAWQIIKNYNESELNAELLKYWGVTKEKKLYYQK